MMICIVLAVSGLLLDWVLRSDLKQEDERFLAAQIQSIRILLRDHPNNVDVWKTEIERDAGASATTFAKYYVRDHRRRWDNVHRNSGNAAQFWAGIHGERRRNKFC